MCIRDSLNDVQLIGEDASAGGIYNEGSTLTSPRLDYLSIRDANGLQSSRGFVWRDEWTTADDVPPALPFVFDANITNFGDPEGDFSDFGGAANPTAALQDLALGTGIVSSVPDGDVLLDLSAPAGLEGAPLDGGIVTTLMSRVGADPVNNRIELLRQSDSSVLSTEDIALTEGAPNCLLYTSPSPRDLSTSRMPSSA